MNFYHLIGNEKFAFNASVFILALGAVTLIHYLCKIFPIYFNIRLMVNRLQKTDGEKGFRVKYDKLNKIFLNNDIIGHSWYEFSECLLQRETKIQNTKKAIEYFSRETLIYGHLNLPFYQSMPNVLTGLGILGTFLGLLCGVSQVDIQKINSIELLLHGASFSFYTSIAGLIASIIFTLCKKASLFLIDSQIQQWVEMLDQRLEWLSPEKIAFITLERQERQIQIFENMADKLGVKISSSFEDITRTEIEILTKIKENTAVSHWKSIEKRLEIMDTHAVSGNDKIAELLGDIKVEIGDQLSSNNQIIVETIQHIAEEFDKFKNKVVRENINSVVEALEVVIKDFNQQVNEQFGENFKEYNEAIRNLLEWQKGHKNHLDQMHEFIDGYLDNIKISTEKFDMASRILESMNMKVTEIVQNLSRLTITTQAIEITMTALDTQTAQMEAFLKSIKEMGDRAGKSIPEIGRKIDQCADDMSESAKQFHAQITSLTSGLSDVHERFSTSASDMTDVMEEMLNGVNSKITSNSEIMTRATEKAATQMERVSVEHSKQVDKTTEQIETGLETLLNESLKSLANCLVALSAKFVEDYTPLTDKLQNVVQIAESIDEVRKKKTGS